MKFVVVTVVRETDPSKAFQFKYPSAYNPNEIEHAKKGPLVYGGQMVYLGEADQEEVLMCLRDDVADKLLADPAGLCRELTKKEANAWLAACPSLDGVPDEEVTDPDRLMLIDIKLRAGMELTKDDRECLDPDHPKAGARRTRARTVAGFFKV